MAITVSTNITKFMKTAGLTSSAEQIFSLDPTKTYLVKGQLTSGSGVCMPKLDIDDSTPSDFTNFVDGLSTDASASFIYEVNKGARWVGLDIASGTWTLSVRQS